MEKKVCSKCGAQLDEEGVCPNCATNIESNSHETKKQSNTTRNAIIVVGSIIIILFVVWMVSSSMGTNVYGVHFNIPDGFQERGTPFAFDGGAKREFSSGGQFIRITVKDNPNNLDDYPSNPSGYYIINGKAGTVNTYDNPKTFIFTYIEDGKTVRIELSGFSGGEEYLLEEIIQ